ncbi:4944_t:CDS:2, partial [Racocetra fulgida]
ITLKFYPYTMSQNKDKLVTVEDEASSSNSSDVEPSHKCGQTNFETNFGRLSMDLLRFLCHELDISEAGVKQDLVNRLASEAKKRCELSGLDNSGKGKRVESDKCLKPSLDDCNKSNVEAFSDGFGNVPSVDVGSRSKSSSDFVPPRLPSAANEMSSAGALLDKALFSGEVEYVYLASQVALERAYVVRVADEDGWSVAAKMAASEILDPMSELFGEK